MYKILLKGRPVLLTEEQYTILLFNKTEHELITVVPRLRLV